MPRPVKKSANNISVIIGIDPGKGGGIASVYKCGTEVCANSMPDTYSDILEILRDYDASSAIVYLEKVHAGPKMGSSAAFKFGEGCGALRMAVISLGIRLELVSPQAWQKHMGLLVKGRGLGQDDTSKKNRNKAKAQELFPGLNITHATADALLIAEYGRQVLSGR